MTAKNKRSDDSSLPPLDPQDWDEYRTLAHRMLDESLDFLRDIRERPTWQPMPTDVRSALGNEPLPREGKGEKAVYEDFLRLVRPYPNGNIHPRFWGWVMGTGTPQSAMADFLSSVVNPNVGGLEQAPVLVEQQVVKWCAELMGFPEGAGGILVSGSFADMGVPMPGVMGPFIALLELVGGLALILGVLTRVFAALLAFDMLGAFFLVHMAGGFFLPAGFEFVFILFAATLALALCGPGAWSVDDRMGARGTAVG